jgi:CubicO group peptidase (beta-lactamase class C family)
MSHAKAVLISTAVTVAIIAAVFRIASVRKAVTGLA